MKILKWILVFILIVVVILLSIAFITHNPTIVEVNLLLMTLPKAKLAVWLIVFFVLGGVMGVLVSSALLVKEKAARLRVEKRLQTTSKLITGQTR